MKVNRGPLSGLTIIDMSTMLLGPLATLSLADLGANVIKVEPPEGDGRRTIGPTRHPKMTSQFLNINRGKRSIVVDAKTTAGRDVIFRLCRNSDAFIHNSRRQAVDRLGLSYQAISTINPKIVYCAAVGFGRNGPYADMPAYDDMIQGLAAIPSLQSKVMGQPQYVPLNLSDRICGLVFSQTILAALLSKQLTGEGQEVELPMFETMADFVLSEHLCGHLFFPPEGELGAQRMFERRPSKTKDGYVCFWLGTDQQCARFFDAIGEPSLKEDVRFSKRANRNKNLLEFFDIVDQKLITKESKLWIEIFRKLDIAAMPLHTLDTLIEDPHLKETGFFEVIEHPTEGAIVNTAIPSYWSKFTPSRPSPAPSLGQNTFEVLLENGYSEEEIHLLLASGAVSSVKN